MIWTFPLQKYLPIHNQIYNRQFKFESPSVEKYYFSNYRENISGANSSVRLEFT